MAASKIIPGSFMGDLSQSAENEMQETDRRSLALPASEDRTHPRARPMKSSSCCPKPGRGLRPDPGQHRPPQDDQVDHHQHRGCPPLGFPAVSSILAVHDAAFRGSSTPVCTGVSRVGTGAGFWTQERLWPMFDAIVQPGTLRYERFFEQCRKLALE